MVQGMTGDNYWGSLIGNAGRRRQLRQQLRVSNAVKYVSPNFCRPAVRRLVWLQQPRRHDGSRPDVVGRSNVQQRSVGLGCQLLLREQPERRPSDCSWRRLEQPVVGFAVRQPRSTSATRRLTRSLSLALQASTLSARSRLALRTAMRSTRTDGHSAVHVERDITTSATRS